jgi:hypothetical protein
MTDAAKCILPVLSRKAMFHAVAKLGAEVQQRIERAAERVVLLDDEYGAQAVQSLLNEQDGDDAAFLAMPSDRYSRARYLWLRQEFPEAGATREQRFDHAERKQVNQRQWKSEKTLVLPWAQVSVPCSVRASRKCCELALRRCSRRSPRINPDRAFHATRSGARGPQ